MTQPTILWFSLLVLWYIVILPAVHSKEVTVKDCPLNDWHSRSITITGKGESWEFATEDSEWINTCGTGKEADFWMVTNYVDLNATFAEVIHVDVEAELKVCFDPGQGSNVQCYVNYFEVHAYRGPKDEKKFPLNPTGLNLLQIYSPIYNITNKTAVGIIPIKSNQTFSLFRNNSQGMEFAIRSKGACGSIFRMKMYYYYCEEAFINGIKFKKTASPAAGSEAIVKGNCTGNTVLPNNSASLNGYCTYNGTWNVDDNVTCACVKDYALDREKGICLPLLVPYSKPILTRVAYGVRITWTEPLITADDEFILTSYYIRCFICNSNASVCNNSCMNEIYNPSQKDLSETSVTVSNLTVGVTYVFSVHVKYRLKGKVTEGQWRYVETDPVVVRFEKTTSKSTTQNSSIKAKPTGQTDKPTKDDFSLIMYIVVGAAAALLLILTILIILCVRRRKRKEIKKNTKGHVNQGGFVNEGVELPTVGQRMYINPSNYDDPQTAVHEFANELDSAMIFLERMVGGGEFGDVYKGELTTKDNKKISIAAKTLRHDADAKSERDFNLEASVMAQFDNPNVVRMEGVVTKSTPRMIILEYMSNGSLEKFLKYNDGMLTNLQLMGMARGVADGMKYLAGIQFVHRDLAARNVLLNDALLCKISDFGLSRVLEEKGSSHAEYSTKGGKIPVRWTAPEAIKYRKFTTASDVWSFGVLLWEVMSFAERPYWEWDNMKVVEQIGAGFRLPPPENCPKGVHDLMLQCWSAERKDRPSFAKIVIIIEKWIRSPETLNDDISFSSPIGNWLTSIKMTRYETNFIEAGYKSTSDITKLTNEDLKNIGISLIGHRNKIMKGINSLKREKRRKSLVI